MWNEYTEGRSYLTYKFCDFCIKKYDDDTIYFIYCKKRAGQKRAK